MISLWKKWRCFQHPAVFLDSPHPSPTPAAPGPSLPCPALRGPQLTRPISLSLVSITTMVELFSQSMRQKSSVVSASGPCVAM